MIKILKFVLFLFVINSYGQKLNTEYWELKKNLLESKTDLIIEFKTDCTGGEFISIEEAEDCVYERPFYIFWLKDGKYYKRKFSNCDVFKTVEMDKSELLKTSVSKINEIKKAEILPVIHTSEKNENGEIETVEMDIDHFCESKFIFHSQSGKIVKTVNHYYLETEMLDEKISNDNYEKNQKSILNTLCKLIEKETE